jgi:S-adenosylmethionine synthetase
MEGLVLTTLAPHERTVEVVERKGGGHPDTICDALAEQLSRDLCALYRDEVGAVLHHNVDKALLSAGRARPAFGGGEVEAPIEIYLGGRATTHVSGRALPITELAVEGARRRLRDQLHALDVDRHVRIHPLLHPGSEDLRELFGRDRATPLANDTSIGVGYAPLSALEQLVLAVERALSAEIRRNPRSPWGEDIKVMGVRTGSFVRLTIACALIGRHLSDLDAYLEETAAIRRLALEAAVTLGCPDCEVEVNAADRPGSGEVYLTVTGTSAEAGDDGQVGRGNRINGLITPGRPMSLEAAAGKNPVSHVGKIYNVAARDIATRVVEGHPDVLRAECLLVSRIGAPIDRPAIAEIGLALRDGGSVARLSTPVADIARDVLSDLPNRLQHFLDGGVSLY